MSEPTDDRKLLLAYHRDGSHEAFGQLAGKYSPMVFQTALRRTRDHQLAEDVTQAVFIVLARRAGTLKSHESIAGWLHQTAIFASSTALRAEAKQRRHELAAAKPDAILQPPDESTERIAKIEEEFHRLPAMHRNVLALHYLEGKTMPETAQHLGVSCETARKRLSRALERLRTRLQRSGFVRTDQAIVAALASAGIGGTKGIAAGVISTAVAGGSNGQAFNMARNIVRNLRMLALKKLASSVAVVGLLGGLVTFAVAQLAVPATTPTTSTTLSHQGTARPTTTTASAETSIEAIANRLELLQAISVAFDETEENISPNGDRRDIGLAPAPMIGKVGQFADEVVPKTTSSRIYSRLGANFRSETQYDRIHMPPTHDLKKLIFAFNGETSAYFQENFDQAEVYGDLDGQIPPVDLIEQMLFGVSGRATHGRYINVDQLRLMDFSTTADGRIHLSRPDEKKRIEEWEFDPSFGYAIVAHRITVPPATFANIETIASEFRMHDSIMLPHRLAMRAASILPGKSERTETYRQTISVKEYTLNDPRNTAEQCAIQWPSGTRVTNQLTGEKFVADKNGRLLSVAEMARQSLIEEARATTRPSSAPSLRDPVKAGTFASVAALTVGEYRSSRLKSLVDLDSQRLLDQPMPSQDSVATMKKMGADLAFLYGPLEPNKPAWAVTGVGTLLMKMPASAWEDATPSAVAATIAAGEPGVTVRGGDGNNYYILGEKPLLPIIFAYRTKDGGVGMLRVKSFADRAPFSAVIEVKPIEASAK